MGKISFCVGVIGVVTLAFTSCATVSEAPPEVLDQSFLGGFACGLCATMNSLAAAGSQRALDQLEGETLQDKTRAFLDAYGTVKGRGAPADAKHR